jgi:rfaE bifunctional protein kinase chain/domain
MTVEEVLSALPSLSALVVGDICLDRWCTYDPSASEPSRETGIVPISVVKTEVTPGAGGTVANNLRALRVGKVAALGVIGPDGNGYELRSALEQRGVDTQLLVTEPSMQTFTYTKFLNANGGSEDQPRVDFRNTLPLAAESENELLDNLKQACPNFDVILVSDQAETNLGGVVTEKLRILIADLATAQERKIFFVDSRKRIELFRNVILKPNEEEASAACKRSAVQNYKQLRQITSAPLLIVTRGGDGALIIDGSGETLVKARRQAAPVDICGAGDSFSAAAAMALAAGASASDAVHLGNLAASVTIMKQGTGTASPEEILEHNLLFTTPDR